LSRRSRGWDRCGCLLWRYTIRFLTTFICRVRGHCTVSWQWWISGTSIKSKIHTCIQLTGQNINNFLEKKLCFCTYTCYMNKVGIKYHFSGVWKYGYVLLVPVKVIWKKFLVHSF
jgi:hypothetical protein